MRSHLNGHVYNVHDTDALWSASIADTHFTARKASFKERAKAAAEALRGILSDLYANGEGNSAISRERREVTIFGGLAHSRSSGHKGRL